MAPFDEMEMKFCKYGVTLVVSSRVLALFMCLPLFETAGLSMFIILLNLDLERSYIDKQFGSV